jgi:hypothetical protein
MFHWKIVSANYKFTVGWVRGGTWQQGRKLFVCSYRGDDDHSLEDPTSQKRATNPVRLIQQSLFVEGAILDNRRSSRHQYLRMVVWESRKRGGEGIGKGGDVSISGGASTYGCTSLLQSRYAHNNEWINEREMSTTQANSADNRTLIRA